MSKRLTSFNGPSTPSSSPVQHRQQPSAPSSPSRHVESTYHRKVRTLLHELRTITHTWDDLVRHDGLKALTSLTDARTELDNALRLIPTGELPRTRIVGPKLEIMEKSIRDLDTTVSKLRKQFAKMNAVVEGLDAILTDAHKSKGWDWVHGEPLWCTWTLEKFVDTIPVLLVPYHRSLEMHAEIVDKLRSHSTPFEEARKEIARWVAQPHLEDESWVADWEDLCEVEVERWNTR